MEVKNASVSQYLEQQPATAVTSTAQTQQAESTQSTDTVDTGLAGDVLELSPEAKAKLAEDVVTTDGKGREPPDPPDVN